VNEDEAQSIRAGYLSPGMDGGACCRALCSKIVVRGNSYLRSVRLDQEADTPTTLALC
jgi:hypothetical protein